MAKESDMDTCTLRARLRDADASINRAWERVFELEEADQKMRGCLEQIRKMSEGYGPTQGDGLLDVIHDMCDEVLGDDE